jgi:riboflavin biosynthesis pyrimidine reductase
VILTRVFPAPKESARVEILDLAVPESRERLLELYRPPRGPWLRMNLITSVGGSAAGSDGTSESLTNSADRKILGVIRELADIVLVGAQSVRAEGFVLPRSARLAIVTGSGNLSGHRITATDDRVYVLCPAAAAPLAAASLPGARIIEVADDRGALDPAVVLETLRAEGFGSIVCEGGPSLVAQFARAGLIDELCLSTSPQLGGPSLPLLGDAQIDAVRLELTQLLMDDSSGLYARWAVTAASSR